ncbi:MAG: N-glycosylase [Clostridia bacterium]|jgi:N-glycosylase/DNA lyase|nr:N-glycosylase [Clostridia bacterium]MCI1998956.1 N-glycosylase [Clostridia bacterium]MCI2013706.1 N-glycosylase [Clostridia bacterium]
MEISVRNNDVIIKNTDSFVISQTLECGQCFRFEKISEENYIVIALGKLLHIYFNKDEVVFENTNIDDFKNIWNRYFDFGRDYKAIKSNLSSMDETLFKAVKYAPGIRILNQDFFECLISFIISQNNRIPMIKKVVSNISRRYGTCIGDYNGVEYYSFPQGRDLANATESELMECKAGFRAKYIIDAVKKYNEGEFDNDKISGLSTDELRKKLMEIKGVGPKVADCVMLFSLSRSEAFPTDVWVKRVMSYFYFGGNDTSLKEIQKMAKEKFGRYEGFAQQYLFNYAREFKIGASEKKAGAKK